MIIPQIFPDEYGQGYLLRLSTLNKYTNTSKALTALRNRLKSQPKALPAQIIAQTLEMTLEEYCQKHTLLPVFRGVTDIEEQVEHGSLNYLPAIKNFTHSARENVYKACKCCVSDDLKHIGVAYIRRAHQLRGIVGCPKHEVKLISLSQQEFFNLKEINLNEHLADAHTDIPLIERYQSIINRMIEFRYPLKASFLYKSLREKARSKGFNVKSRGCHRLLGNFLKAQLPEDWVREVLPPGMGRTIEKSLNSIDSLVSGKNKVFRSETYLIAIAGLHENSESAVQFLESHLSLG